jgi:hypothetical protein
MLTPDGYTSFQIVTSALRLPPVASVPIQRRLYLLPVVDALSFDNKMRDIVVECQGMGARLFLHFGFRRNDD